MPAALHVRTEKTRVCHWTVDGGLSHAYTNPHAEQSGRCCYTSVHTGVEQCYTRTGSVTRVVFHTRGGERHGWCYRCASNGVTCMTVSHVLRRTGFHVLHMDDSVTGVLHIRQQHHPAPMQDSVDTLHVCGTVTHVGLHA